MSVRLAATRAVVLVLTCTEQRSPQELPQAIRSSAYAALASGYYSLLWSARSMSLTADTNITAKMSYAVELLPGAGGVRTVAAEHACPPRDQAVHRIRQARWGRSSSFKRARAPRSAPVSLPVDLGVPAGEQVCWRRETWTRPLPSTGSGRGSQLRRSGGTGPIVVIGAYGPDELADSYTGAHSPVAGGEGIDEC